MNRTVRTIIIYVAVVTVLWLGYSAWFEAATKPDEINLNQFNEQIASGDVGSVRIFPTADRIDGRFNDTAEDAPADFSLYYPGEYEDELINQLESADVDIATDPEPTSLGTVLISLLPWIFIIGFMIFIFTQMQGGGNRVMQFGKSKAKQITKDQPKVTFGDVAGLDEAVEELAEIKDFLQNPAKFRAMGAKIPKGVLLYGPPGTGQDASGSGHRRRGRGSVLLDLRFGFRRDVRRCRCQPGP